MKMKRMVLIALTVLLTAGLAAADPITGGITFTGGVSLNGASVLTATQVSAWSATVFASTLPLAGNPPLAGSPVTFFRPWVFSPGNQGAPIASFWSVGGWAFQLNSWTINHQDAAELSIDGIGTLSGHGYDLTPGSFHFSTQTVFIDPYFTFSASSGTLAAVPEPASLLLLTAGIGGLGLFRRRK